MKLKKSIISSVVAIGALMSMAAGATHADAPPGEGWDGTPDVVVAGGSDTTYLVSQRLEALYNGAPGCQVDTSATSANKAKCIVTSTATATVGAYALSGNTGFVTFTGSHTIVATQTAAITGTGNAAIDGNRVINGIVASDLNIASVTAQVTAGEGDRFNVTNSLVVGQPIMFTTSAGAPITAGTKYFVKARAGSYFTVASVLNGTGITGVAAGAYSVKSGVSFTSNAADIALTASGGTATAVDPASTKGNYDHDVFVSATPTGSGAGTNSLLPGGVGYNPGINIGRSSSLPSASDLANVTAWGFARDGIAVLTFGTRAGYKLTQAELQGIYNCSITDWGSIPQKDASGNAIPGSFYPAGPIIAWDMNAASGTRATLNAKVPITGTCVRKLATGIAPFENDVKPLLADPGPDGAVNTADDDENNYIWWMSYGNWSKYPYTKNGCANGVGTYNISTLACTGGTTVNGNLAYYNNVQPGSGNILDNSYPFARVLYYITDNEDADCVQAASTAGACNNVGSQVYGKGSGGTDGLGGSAGKSGAVRNFVEFLCKPNNSDFDNNPVTGRSYRLEINSALSAEGFSSISALAGDRTAGYACNVATQ